MVAGIVVERRAVVVVAAAGAYLTLLAPAAVLSCFAAVTGFQLAEQITGQGSPYSAQKIAAVERRFSAPVLVELAE